MHSARALQPEVDEAAPGRLIGRASVVAAGTTYQQGMAFLSGLVVARVIGAADFGIFNLARNLLDLAAIVTRLGLEVGLQRHFGEAGSGANASRVAVLRRVRWLAGTLALLPALAIGLGLGDVIESRFYRHAGFADILLCLALALPFLTDLAILGGAYRGILRLTPAVLAECVLLPTLRLLIIVALFLAGWRLWAVVAGTTLGSLLASAFLARRAALDFRGDGRSQPWNETFRVMRYSGVLAGAVLVTTLMTSMDLLVLGRFASAEDLGQYSLARMLMVLMGVFGFAFSQGLGALVAARYARSDLPGVARAMSTSARLVALLSVPVFGVFLFWGAQLTLLFGRSFDTPQAVLGWLAASQYVFIVLGPSGWGLSMTGRHVLELAILVGGLAVAALLCWYAIPVYGQLGAAFASFAAVTLTNLARVSCVRRAIGAWPFGADVLRITAAGIGLAWVCNAATVALLSDPFWRAFWGIACLLCGYGALAWAWLLDDAERRGLCTTFASIAGKWLPRC